MRHYFLRRGSNQADIQVNLLPEDDRSRQSHEIAKAMRGPIQEIGRRWNARVKIAEVPPGPPVLSTLVAEVYGPDYGRQIELARQVREIFEATPGVVDVDWYVVADAPKLDFQVEQDKAALAGVSAADVSETLAIALGGMDAGLMHAPAEREDVPIRVRLARASRSSADALAGIYLPASGGTGTPGAARRTGARRARPDRKEHLPEKSAAGPCMSSATLPGRRRAPSTRSANWARRLTRLRLPEGYQVEQFTATQPPDASRLAIKWDGEWHITYEVFRDLGLAFAAVLVLIYVLVVGWFQSFKTPLVIMAPIPLTLVGILPAHALAGAFFTATSMIGFIAGAGIIVRNSIILVDFIKLRRAQGMSLEDAVVDAGAVRFRPMLLTAAAVVVGAGVILFDPIFQGLAISLMAGEVASTVLSRMAVPVLYYLSERGGAS